MNDWKNLRLSSVLNLGLDFDQHQPQRWLSSLKPVTDYLLTYLQDLYPVFWE